MMMFLNPMSEDELRQWPILYRDETGVRPPLMANITIKDDKSGSEAKAKVFLDRLGLFIIVLDESEQVESKISSSLNYENSLVWAKLMNQRAQFERKEVTNL